jgi:ribosomal protein S18 acetylase RimI-like enzyme
VSDIVDRFYADYLGCSVGALTTAGVSTGVQSEERRYNGVFVWRRADSVVFSAPQEHLGWVDSLVQGRPLAELWGQTPLLELFDPHVERIIGPVWLGFLQPNEFRPVETRAACVLGRADARALWDLEVACAPQEWRHAGIGLDLPVVVGCHDKNLLVAVAGYQLWSREMAHIGVATHPAYRRQGYGKAVVSALTSYGIARGLTLQYRALEDNVASIGLATALGFQHYATTYSVRLNFPSGDRTDPLG